MRLGPELLLCVLACSTPLAADTTLSVVPLAKALQNSELHGDSPDQARKAVTDLLLNHPAGEEETNAFHARLAALARHKDTRVGRVFFRCLETLPDVQQVPQGARDVELLVRRPLAMEASARVHVAWRLEGEHWKVSRLDVYLEGPGAAPVVKAPPYFAEGEVPGEWLDAEELDYLVGRDPTLRNEPDKEPFDFSAAMEKYLAADAGAYEALIQQLRKEVTPKTERPARIAALYPHLTRDGQASMEKADADDSLRERFWKAVFDNLAQAEKAVRPSSVPTTKGSEVKITAKDADGQVLSECVVQRLQTGEIAPRVRVKEVQDGDQSD
jgi:hypothetical protein